MAYCPIIWRLHKYESMRLLYPPELISSSNTACFCMVLLLNSCRYIRHDRLNMTLYQRQEHRPDDMSERWHKTSCQLPMLCLIKLHKNTQIDTCLRWMAFTERRFHHTETTKRGCFHPSNRLPVGLSTRNLRIGMTKVILVSLADFGAVYIVPRHSYSQSYFLLQMKPWIS